MSINEITIQAYYQAVKLMFSGTPITAGMRELSAQARGLAPHPIWEKLQRIDYDRHLPGLQEWAAAEIARQPEAISILFFRIADLAEKMDLVFLRSLRQPTGDGDWDAYQSVHTVEVPVPPLVQMYELAEADLTDEQGGYIHEDVGWIVETCYPLAYCGLLVGQLMRSLPLEALLGRDEQRLAAVFFANGDDFILGQVTRAGFQYRPLPDFIPQA
jgi:hypothetical protein